MGSKRNFSDINTPASLVQGGKNLKFGLKWNEHFGKQKRADFIKAQEIVDSECLRYMDKLTPMRTGMMIKSATLGTVIGSGEINYLAPYARRQYYNNSGGSPAHPQARGMWFESMKASYRDSILKAAGGAFRK